VSVYKVGQLRYACFKNTQLANGETPLFEAAQASPNKSGQALTNFLEKTLDSVDKH
jgi:hypothetical protein